MSIRKASETIARRKVVYREETLFQCSEFVANIVEELVFMLEYIAEG